MSQPRLDLISTEEDEVSPPFRFQDLPGELRTRIYEMAFEGAVDNYNDNGTFHPDDNSEHRDILMASKDCYREGKPVYEKTVKISLTVNEPGIHSAATMLKDLGAAFMSRVSEVVLKDYVTLSDLPLFGVVCQSCEKLECR